MLRARPVAGEGDEGGTGGAEGRGCHEVVGIYQRLDEPTMYVVSEDLALPPRLLAMPSYVLSLAARPARASSIATVARSELRLGRVAVLATIDAFCCASQRALGARLRQD